MIDEVEDNRDEMFGSRPPTPEELTVQFQAQLRELGQSPVELADRMHALGDHRPYSTILRGVQRMLSGETRVSGEISVLMTMMLREHRRMMQNYAAVTWKRLSNGSHTTEVDEFRVTLIPKTRGRWLINLVHKDGYSPPWPRWQDNLDAAKRKAMLCIVDATDYLSEIENINRDEPSESLG